MAGFSEWTNRTTNTYQTTWSGPVWAENNDHTAPTAETARTVNTSTFFDTATGSYGIPSTTVPAVYAADAANAGKLWFRGTPTCSCNTLCTCNQVCVCLTVCTCNQVCTCNTVCSCNCNCCVLEGAMIHVPGGFKAVETLQPGELVEAFDEHTWESIVSELEEIRITKNQLIYEIVTDRGTRRASMDHLVFANGAWMRMRNLRTGDIVNWVSGNQLTSAKVISSRCLKEYATVYHVLLKTGHVYVADGLCAHNKDK